MILSSLAVLVAASSVVCAQPSPDVQRRISAAIQAAIRNGSNAIDYTAFVNPFIGTGTSHLPTEVKLESNLKYTISSYQTILEMYGSCPVCDGSSICLPTHPLCHSPGASVPFGMVCYVP